MTTQGTSSGGKRVLLVEDHADTAKVMAMLLRRDGHTVDIASTLAEAEEQCKSNSYDLLISDIELPDGYAWDLVAELGVCGGMKGIVISGHGMQEHIQRSTAAGFKAHLVKPFQISDLRAAIANVAGNGH